MSSELENKDLINRREFTVESVMALLAGVTITVTGCGGGDDSPSAPTSPSPSPTADVTGSVSANHGHRVTVTAAQITAASTIMVDIRGDATHPHTLELTGDELRRIGQRQQVAKTSTTDAGHSHTVTFN